MPELPEVEHARRWLERWLVGARLTAVQVHDHRILDAGVRESEVAPALVGRRISAVTRRGKWLRVSLDGAILFSHLGMTGKWQEAPRATPSLRFEKVRLDAVEGRSRRSVRYTDPRLFGRFVVVEGEQDLEAWGALGPDPLVDGIDLDALAAKLSGRTPSIKAVLMDQAVLAGVGNIVATEALFHARIDPRRRAGALLRQEVAAVARGVRQTIRRSLARDGNAPTIVYVEEPGAENPFVVYGREGEPCPRCGDALQKIALAGRGTVFCGACQR